MLAKLKLDNLTTNKVNTVVRLLLLEFIKFSVNTAVTVSLFVLNSCPPAGHSTRSFSVN